MVHNAIIKQGKGNNNIYESKWPDYDSHSEQSRDTYKFNNDVHDKSKPTLFTANAGYPQGICIHEGKFKI